MPCGLAAERAPLGRALFSFCRFSFISHRRTSCIVLVLACLLYTHITVAQCPADRIDERVWVAHVHDGDTLVLRDGRKVRLIGVNAPELPREGDPGQPYAEESRDALRGLLAPPGDELGLHYDGEHFDRYGRLLAHLYRRDGASIQAWMLEHGYAAAIAVPPNLENQECYRRAEGHASAGGLGMWRLAYYRPLPSAAIGPDSPDSGFRFVRGKVIRAGAGAGAVWLNLEGGLALRIARPDLDYFPGFRSRDFIGRTVVARGWLITRGAAPLMQIRHPSSLQVVADDG